ncbi:OpgC family protein [Yoonia sp. BS5-3]|uniref:OpgC family protein n=1 Tax=Yoonia phaeophyticola TaxID=3137369 RepID=A0ABZ2V8L8_9RHOB
MQTTTLAAGTAAPHGATTATTPHSAAAAKPAATTRDVRLDFFRGIAMFIILIAHTPGNWVTRWIPARWGFSDATEIFVFCSGMASAIAFGAVFAKRGMWMGTARVAFRTWQVYWAHIALFFAIAATMVALNGIFPDGRDYVGQLNLHPFFNNAQTNLLGLLTLTYVPNYFDILPMYLVILAMLPLMVLLSRAHVGLVFAAMFILWAFAQGRILEMIGLEAFALDFPAEPWSERTWFFNPFGWQLVFFTGFAFMMRWLPAPPRAGWLFLVALAVVLANIPLSNIGTRELDLDWARDWRSANSALFFKSDFGILRYVQFLALAYVAWFLAGPMGARIRAREGGGIGAQIWAMVLAVIMKVGQQSLAVFVFSMFFARLMGVMFDLMGRSHATMVLVNAIGFAAIIGIAYLAAWFKSQPWKTRRQSNAAA